MKKNNKQLTKAQIIAKFEEFLKENNCYEEFVENFDLNVAMKSIDKFYSTYTESSNFDDLVSGAFQWYQSEQGDEFWEELHKKWQSRYEELISEEN